MRYLVAVLAALLVTGTAYAESAVTVRATELQVQAQADAATIATLPENTKVTVLRRVGAWREVKTADGKTGWVRMLTLKFEGGGTAQGTTGGSSPFGALGSLLSSGRTANTGTSTTGVRGLTEEELQNAQANPEELEKMRKFAVDKPSAQAFAKRSKLTSTQLEYMPEPAPVRVESQQSSSY